MSGEAIVVRGTTKVLESNGGQIASGSIVQATNAYDTVADGANFPDVEFVLTGTFAAAPTEGTVLALYAQPLAIDGTNNSEVPETTRPTVPIGTFTVNNVTTLQAIPMNGIYAPDVPQKAYYYVYNYLTGQALAAGWQLRATPRSRKLAP